MKLRVGKHDVMVKNRYLGEGTESIDVKDEGPKPRVVTVVW